MVRNTGTYVKRTLYGAEYRAFIPKPLPPEPSLAMTDEMFHLMENANRALGRLDGITTLLPDAYLFTYFYLRKEAVLSSQIEELNHRSPNYCYSKASKAQVFP